MTIKKTPIIPENRIEAIALQNLPKDQLTEKKVFEYGIALAKRIVLEIANSRMVTMPVEYEVFTEHKSGLPTAMTLRLDGSDPDCPIIFIIGDEEVFRITNWEIDDFKNALSQLSVL